MPPQQLGQQTGPHQLSSRVRHGSTGNPCSGSLRLRDPRYEHNVRIEEIEEIRADELEHAQRYDDWATIDEIIAERRSEQERYEKNHRNPHNHCPGICQAVIEDNVAAVRGITRHNPRAVEDSYKGPAPQSRSQQLVAALEPRSRGSTVLHLAVEERGEEMVKVLLEAKASVEAKNNKGRGPQRSDFGEQRLEDGWGLINKIHRSQRETNANQKRKDQKENLEN